MSIMNALRRVFREKESHKQEYSNESTTYSSSLQEMIGIQRAILESIASGKVAGPGDIHSELWRRACETSVDFVEQHLADALIFKDSGGIRRHALASSPVTGLVMECGVWVGRSINAFADQLAERTDSRTIYGFDSFEGLSEDWVGHEVEKGFFSLGGKLPEVRNNVSLIKGWVDDTIPKFLADTPGEIAFLHVDTDTYSPCKTILSCCKRRFVPGTIVLFDELLAYPGWQHGEFKALNEILRPDQYRWRAFGGFCASLEIIKPIED